MAHLSIFIQNHDHQQQKIILNLIFFTLVI